MVSLKESTAWEWHWREFLGDSFHKSCAVSQIQQKSHYFYIFNKTPISGGLSLQDDALQCLERASTLPFVLPVVWAVCWAVKI